MECQALARFDDAPRPRDTDAGLIEVIASAGVEVSLEYEAEDGRYMARYPGNGVRADGVDGATIALSGRGSATVGYGVVPGALMKDAFASAPEYPCIGCASLMIVRELVTHVTAGDYDLEIRRA